MIYDYFAEFEKEILSGTKPAQGSPRKGGGKGKGHAKAGEEKSPELSVIQEKLSRIIPSSLVLSNMRPIDSSGFSPEGADFIAYREYCRDIVQIMNGHVPCELIHGTFHVVQDLNRDTLYDALKRVINVKKVDRFSNTSGEESIVPIPAFILVLESQYSFVDLKNDIVNFYINKSVEHAHEMDLLMIMNRGIVVKNWREKRSFIALQTEADSMLSFFILMNEYLEMSRGKDLDFRAYTRKDVQYKEF
ncbi:MAG: hypothetical protein JXA20_08855 [Spirochaetes bacterium]|nr:hypothetical protein [Spirochaetota bacterium]